jgi:hypothetical protein
MPAMKAGVSDPDLVYLICPATKASLPAGNSFRFFAFSD